MGETDGRGDPPASTFSRATEHRKNHRARQRASPRLAEAGVGSGQGSRQAAAGPVTRAAVPQVSPRAPAPSWRRVLATTISLWMSRRLPTVGTRWWPGTGQRPASPRFRWAAWPRRRPSARSLRPPILLVALTATAVAVLRFAGTSSPAARPLVPASPPPARAGQSAARAGTSAGTAAVVRSQAAAWIAGQVSGGETIACDPLMCAELHAHGVASGRLLPLLSDAGVSGADLIVAPASVSSQLSNGAPVLLASFGSGPGQMDVRAISPDQPAAYNSALQADLAARRSAGAQLLHSERLAVGAQAAGQLEAGDVDSRVLVTLATLASLQPLRVVSFGDASPGDRVPLAEMPFRQVTVAITDSVGAAAGLAAAMALLRAQRSPYQPDQVTVLDPAGGQAELRIGFAVPSPLGLLTGGVPG
jgi:hypothetical protein